MPRFTPLSESDDFALSALVDSYGFTKVLEALSVKAEQMRHEFQGDADFQAQLTHTITALDAAQRTVSTNYRQAGSLWRVTGVFHSNAGRTEIERVIRVPREYDYEDYAISIVNCEALSAGMLFNSAKATRLR